MCYGGGTFILFSRVCPSHGVVIPADQSVLPIKEVSPLARGGMHGHRGGP